MFILGHSISRDGQGIACRGRLLLVGVDTSKQHSWFMVFLKSFGVAPLVSSSLDVGPFCSARSDFFLSLKEVRHIERGYLNF